MAKYQLTPNKLLILAAIRHLQPCQIKQLAGLLSKPKNTIWSYLYGQPSCYPGLIERGYIVHTPRTRGTFHLTEAGEQAIRDVCLIKENGRYSVGEVIRRYDQEVIK